LEVARQRIALCVEAYRNGRARITENLDFEG
jgi:hypothetical protein